LKRRKVDLGSTFFSLGFFYLIKDGSAWSSIIDKSSNIFVKEDQSIGATAGTADKIVITASWEEIS
jgi:hypothetical protein